MIVHGHRVYRGHRGGASSLPAVLLTLLFLLLLGLLAAFSLLPEYLVYHRESVSMVVPMLEENGQGYTVESVASPAPYAGTALSQMEIKEPDYTDVDMVKLAGMNYLRGYYVPQSKITETGLDTAVSDASRNGLQGLILQMKDESGKLAWNSQVALASGNAANSSWDPSSAIAELKAKGWYLAAEISCAVDTLLATKNPETALKAADGSVYQNSAGAWVDPWNRTVRSYTAELAEDLLRMGFDEIILTRVEHPSSEVGYTRSVAKGLSRRACVMNFSTAVRGQLDKALTEHGAHLCIKASHDIFSTEGAANGQDLDDLLRVYDRIVVLTASYNKDVSFFIDRGEDSTLRFVPEMTWAFGGASVILDTAAPREEK